MKEGVKKSISLILVLTLLVQLLPVVAFGVGDETNDLDISTDSETVSMKDDDAEIVGEEDGLREESVKHFTSGDGGSCNGACGRYHKRRKSLLKIPPFQLPA